MKIFLNLLPIFILVLNIVALQLLPSQYGSDISLAHLCVLGFATITQLGSLLIVKISPKKPNPIILITYLFIGFIFSSHYLGSDHLRYIYDGNASVTDRSEPFVVSPDDATPLPESNWWTKDINHPSYTSIYPIGAQLYFMASSYINPFKTPSNNFQLEFGLRLIMFLVCAATVFFYHSKKLALIFMQPLWFIAAFCNLHIDAIMCMFLYIFLMQFYKSKQTYLDFFSLLYSITIKWYSAILFPVYLMIKTNLQYKKIVILTIASAVIIFSAHYLYFGGAMEGYFNSLFQYTRHWYFFGPAHTPINLVYKYVGLSDPSLAARLTCFAGFFACLSFIYRAASQRKIAFIKSLRLIIVLLLFFSPVNHPWYLLALAPMALPSKGICLEDAWINLCLVSYSSYYFENQSTVIELIYSGLTILIVYKLFKRERALSLKLIT